MIGSLGSNVSMQGLGQQPDNSAYNRFSQVGVPKWMQAQGIGSLTDPRAMSFMSQNPNSPLAQSARQALGGGQGLQPTPVQPIPGGPMQSPGMQPPGLYPRIKNLIGGGFQGLAGGQGGNPWSTMVYRGLMDQQGPQVQAQGPQVQETQPQGSPLPRAINSGTQYQGSPLPRSINGGGLQAPGRPNPSIGAPPPGQIKSVNGGGLQAPSAPVRPTAIRADRGMNQAQMNSAVKTAPMASAMQRRRQQTIGA